MYEVSEKKLLEAIAAGHKVMIENHNPLPLRKHYGTQDHTQERDLPPGHREFHLMEVTIGRDSPVYWLVLPVPSGQSFHEGVSIKYLVGEHNTGRIEISIEEREPVPA